MTDLSVDVLVIGWGKGGKTLAGALAQHGRTVAVVERSADMIGGSCININCVPTKTLIHDAASLPFADAVARRDALTEKLRAANRAMLADADQVTLIDGQARFLSDHEVEVRAGDDVMVVHGDTIIVNTGTVPATPFAVGGRVHDSTTIQHVDPLPQTLAIIGSGFVALEFAGMFADFGSDVMILGRDEEFLPGEDRDVADVVREILDDAGVRIELGRSIESPDEVDADAVLLATGRRPATDELGLDAAGIEADADGFIVVDERLRTSQPHIFAVGDVNGGPQFTYISWDDHRIVFDQLTGEGTRSTQDRVAVPQVTFLTPPFARVGLNETEARAAGREVVVGVQPVADIAVMPRPKIVGQTRGIMKVVIDADSDEILGATLVCVDAHEVINLIALAMRMGATASQLRDGIWTHPSMTEGLSGIIPARR